MFLLLEYCITVSESPFKAMIFLIKPNDTKDVSWPPSTHPVLWDKHFLTLKPAKNEIVKRLC